MFVFFLQNKNIASAASRKANWRQLRSVYKTLSQGKVANTMYYCADIGMIQLLVVTTYSSTSAVVHSLLN